MLCDEPNEVEVHPGESIQKAVDDVSPGGTVVIFPGTYSGTIILAKTINIRSSCEDHRDVFIAATERDPAVVLKGLPEVSVDRPSRDEGVPHIGIKHVVFRYEGSESGPISSAGIRLEGRVDIDLARCEFRDLGKGIDVAAESEATVSHCKFVNCKAGISFEGMSRKRFAVKDSLFLGPEGERKKRGSGFEVDMAGPLDLVVQATTFSNLSGVASLGEIHGLDASFTECDMHDCSSGIDVGDEDGKGTLIVRNCRFTALEYHPIYSLYSSIRVHGSGKSFVSCLSPPVGFIPATIRKPLAASSRSSVSVPEDGLTLQEAIDVSLPGGVICLSKTVEESIVLDKPLLIRGAGTSSCIRGEVFVPCGADGVVLEDLTIDSKVWSYGESVVLRGIRFRILRVDIRGGGTVELRDCNVVGGTLFNHYSRMIMLQWGTLRAFACNLNGAHVVQWRPYEGGDTGPVAAFMDRSSAETCTQYGHSRDVLIHTDS